MEAWPSLPLLPIRRIQLPQQRKGARPPRNDPPRLLPPHGRSTLPRAHQTRRDLRVLDLGAGTGLWAIRLGDEHPGAAQVVGNDLSPIPPEWCPPNVKFV